jgi:hypothetical protein
MLRPAPLLLGTVALALVTPGCGDDDRQVDPEPPRLTIGHAESATAALPSVRATDVVRRGGAYTRARNLVAVLPQAPAEKGPYRLVWSTFRRLATR